MSALLGIMKILTVVGVYSPTLPPVTLSASPKDPYIIILANLLSFNISKIPLLHFPSLAVPSPHDTWTSFPMEDKMIVTHHRYLPLPHDAKALYPMQEKRDSGPINTLRRRIVNDQVTKLRAAVGALIGKEVR